MENYTKKKQNTFISEEEKTLDWNDLQNSFKKTFGTEIYNSWLQKISLVKEYNDYLILGVPTRFFRDWIVSRYLDKILEQVKNFKPSLNRIEFKIIEENKQNQEIIKIDELNKVTEIKDSILNYNRLNPNLNFDSFIKGKSNDIALSYSKKVCEHISRYNPLYICGGVGLGKTHLMHAVGNEILQNEPNKRIVYVHSEKFVSDMVKALQLGAMNEFKSFYRNADALLIDDIQFFAGKEQSQEEFFHTFNALLDRNNQMILTCDKYPKEIDGLEERLKSRLGWGLPVVIDPPELETRAAVLLQKASSMGVELPSDCAIYIAQRIRSNIRELEGALKRVVANARFTNQSIDLALVKDALKDLFVISAKMVSIENIQKTVAEYYNIKLSDLLSKRRSRSITRPRQLAMALTKDLTRHSLPEIGEAFNGRDHTTVLHACKKIAELRKESPSHEEDYRNLNRALTN